MQNSAQALQEEKEEVKRRLEEATARVLQLEEDLIGVTQKGLLKETELDKWVQDLRSGCRFIKLLAMFSCTEIYVLAWLLEALGKNQGELIKDS